MVGYLGPEGSFSEEAAVKVKADEYIAFSTIPKLLKAFWNGEIDKAVIPIENSIEGTVVIAIDRLINGNGNSFVIEGEIELPIKQNLIGIDCEISKIETAGSHPQALAQCTNFIEKLGIETISFDSTSAAVEQVAEKQDSSFAAIGTERAAEIYGLKVIRKNIQDSDNNVTRFLVLGHEANIQTSIDKTSIIFEVNNEPGALLRVLEVFDALDINMTNIVSRPSKKELGKYIFWVDIEGHQDDARINVALEQIKTRTAFLKVLGSYPKTEM
ncbi:MAG: prephenate dehydratase [Candidatus Pacebacteria bacterium]|nr:prephenate dehydratase [Candidatus Paceibacterota bacterium]